MHIIDWLTAILASVGFLQLLVFAWQGFQLKRTVDVAIRTDEPKVVLHNLTFRRHGDSDPLDNTKLPMVTVTFKNYGQQFARITEACLEMCLLSELPKKPTYKSKTSAPVGRIIEPGKEYEFPSRPWYDTQALERLARCMGERPEEQFCVYGFVAYRDHLGKGHKTGFLAWWNTLGAGFGWEAPIDPKLRGTTFVTANKKYYTYET